MMITIKNCTSKSTNRGRKSFLLHTMLASYRSGRSQCYNDTVPQDNAGAQYPHSQSRTSRCRLVRRTNREPLA